MADQVAGLLLTGGASRRMGREKATLRLGPGGEPLARHLGRLLTACCSPVLEVGGGRSGLPALSDSPRQGPLGAVAAGAAALSSVGHAGPALVLATDLPFVSGALLAALAAHPADAAVSVVPLVGGRLQPLCARWSPASLALAAELVAAGERRAQAAFFGASSFLALSPEDLGSLDLARELEDLDEPGDLRRLGLAEGPSSS